MCETSDLRAALVAAGRTYGERLHPLPIYDGHRDELDDVQADVNSTGASRYGGACTAAAFLEKFINGTGTSHNPYRRPHRRGRMGGITFHRGLTICC
eukprot:m.853217 g.853217  ORF g.853217 m.853217 type:complete len:97 (+) comp23500_c0_seq5:2000-2290(+)